tara:strand:+ start:969 stop:2048 length:1080 start_codon:yes stop_codon:yes gene_type:complete
MAISPYRISQAKRGQVESYLEAQRKKEESRQQTRKQMGVMTKELTAQIAEAEKKANQYVQNVYQDAHYRKRRGKRKGWLSGLSMLFPIFGGIASGLLEGKSMYDEAKSRGRHGIAMATQAQAAANIDTSRWGRTFLGKGAQRWQTEADRYYGDLLVQARQAHDLSEVQKVSQMAGVMEGLTSWQQGKQMQDIGKSFMDKWGSKRELLGKRKLFGEDAVTGKAWRADSGLSEAGLKPSEFKELNKLAKKDFNLAADKDKLLKGRGDVSYEMKQKYSDKQLKLLKNIPKDQLELFTKEGLRPLIDTLLDIPGISAKPSKPMREKEKKKWRAYLKLILGQAGLLDEYAGLEKSMGFALPKSK